MSNEFKALQSLSQNYADLFSPEDCNDLESMFSQKSNDLGEAISKWMRNHEYLRPAYLELLKLELLKQSNATKCAGGGGGDPVSPEESKKLQQEIINTIRVASPQNNKPPESK